MDTSAPVTTLSDLPVGAMKVARAGNRRVLLARTEAGVFALDHGCPHQGYGLSQGSLDAESGLLTCAWHNWKFRVADGRCVLGEEDVVAHRVRIDGEAVFVEVDEPTPAQERERLFPSLRRGIEEHYNGQIARDVVRLLRAEADPAELIWEGVALGTDRAEFGWGHALAVAADALELLGTGEYAGDERAFPIVNALAGVAETERRRPSRPRPEPLRSLPSGDLATTFRGLVEREDTAGAEAFILGAFEAGLGAADVRPWLVGAVSDHHLSFGHYAIYLQKAFSLLDHLGADRAAAVLGPLAFGIVHGTREDTLPYFRAPAAAVRALDLAALAEAPDRRDTGWVDEDTALRRAILDGPEPPVAAAAEAVLAGAGIEGLLDTVVLAASDRLLRHDPAEDTAPTDFGWLDITHVMTYADAARWAWRSEPGPDTARLALWTVLMAHDSGRAERRRQRPALTVLPAPAAGDLRGAVEAGQADDAVAIALGVPDGTAGAALERAALSDLAGSFIVSAHLVKTARAARREAPEVGSNLPLAATARFMASPRVERFVSSATTEAIHLAERGTPLPR
jgi:nitrite reductase/ring-hydroxylating ferredoxin subunit